MPSTVKNQICSKIITNYFLFLTSYCHLTRTVSQRPFRILNFFTSSNESVILFIDLICVDDQLVNVHPKLMYVRHYFSDSYSADLLTLYVN